MQPLKAQWSHWKMISVSKGQFRGASHLHTVCVCVCVDEFEGRVASDSIPHDITVYCVPYTCR